MAKDAGLTPQRVRTLVGRGRLRRVLQGVYVDARAPDTVDARAGAAALVVPPGHVLGRMAAAWVFGVPPLLPGAHLKPPPLDMLGPAGTSALRRDGVRGRVAVLPDEDVTVIGQVRLTVPARTTLDLARELERPHGLAYVDAMLRAEVVSPESLRAGLERLGGFPWVEQARELVALGDPRAESPGESWMRLRWLDAGLPEPDLQIPALLNGRVFARIDAGVEKRRFGFEYDGEEFHGPEQQAFDAARREWLRRERGWRMLAFGKGETLGRGVAFEAAIAEVFGLEPQVVPWELRRRTYLHRRRRSTKPA